MNLNQVTVPSKNIKRSIDFYTPLGLKLIVHSTDKYARFICPEGESTFSVQYVNSLYNEDGIHVYFEANELDQKVTQLIEDGIVMEELPEDKVWLWREAKLRDPDNNLIILYTAGTNRINPPWRLSD